MGGGHCSKEKILTGSDQSGLIPGVGIGLGPPKEHGCCTSRRAGVDVWEKSTKLTLIILHISGRQGKRASELGKWCERREESTREVPQPRAEGVLKRKDENTVNSESHWI